MSYAILRDGCINCGGCEFCCPTEAIQRPGPGARHPAAFWIETYRCNDCAFCVTVCPTDCIHPDPDTVACLARGCPVAADRRGAFAGWECSLLEALCEGCGHVLWRSGSADEWACVRCASNGAAGRQRCPKVLLLEKAGEGTGAALLPQSGHQLCEG